MLADGVGDVEQLDGHVAGDEVITVELAADKTAELSDEVFDAHDAASAVLTLCQQVTIHLIDNVTNRLQPPANRCCHCHIIHTTPLHRIRFPSHRHSDVTTATDRPPPRFLISFCVCRPNSLGDFTF